MGEQLVDRVLQEIRERMNASRGAVDESRRLEAALAALDRNSARERPRRAPSRRAIAATKSPAKRAPRGQNLRRIREAIDERPGASAGEIAAATGIARPTVVSTLSKLVRDGQLERRELPGGGVGFLHAPGAPAGMPADDDTSPHAGQAHTPAST